MDGIKKAVSSAGKFGLLDSINAAVGSGNGLLFSAIDRVRGFVDSCVGPVPEKDMGSNTSGTFGPGRVNAISDSLSEQGRLLGALAEQLDRLDNI